MDAKQQMSDWAEQFQEMWKRFGGMAPDWSKVMAWPEAQTDFWKSVMEANQNNMQALAEMNDAVAKSMTSIGERQRALLETMMAEVQQAGKEMSGSGEEVSKAASEAFEKMLNGMREIAQIAEKANKDALAEIEKRSSAFQEEMQGIMAKAKS